MAGYHEADIPKGIYGELSKIDEEIAEFKDAVLADNKLLILNELVDIVGAIDGYLDRHFKSEIDFKQLMKQVEATKRAFKSGQRR